MNNSLTDAISGCEAEPIHTPGLIQPHGALLCFSASGRLLSKSTTAAQWLGVLPDIGETLSEQHLDANARTAIHDALADINQNADTVEWTGPQGKRFDLVIHWSGTSLIVEWELIVQSVATLAHYAVLARRSIRQLQERSYDSVAELLQAGADTIRDMTCFDRVMAYRFLDDDSGEVVAEAKRNDLRPYLQQRYPASDIPPQARRLYILSPIRQISSVMATPVALEPAINTETGRPHDLSHSVLRSVSPVHIEYLRNMGVAASMSISIVVNDRLWGLFACHHMTEHRAPHAVRLACVLFTEVVTVLIQKFELKQRLTLEQRIYELRADVANALAGADDPISGLLEAARGIAAMVDSDAVAVVVDTQALTLGAPALESQAALLRLADFMSRENLDLIVSDCIETDWPELARPQTLIGHAAGLLAIQMNGEARITIAWLRDELVQTIKWAGPPDKVVAQGPNGPRLTPRGSFELWQQTVTGSSRAWTETDSFAARELKSILQDVALQRLREADQARMILLATLAHDLRDPLQTVDLAIELLESGLKNAPDTVARVKGSTRRMQSLITYILDVSSIRAGIGLGLTPRRVSLRGVIEGLLEQLRASSPGTIILAEIGDLGDTDLDEDRFGQALSNLIGNARKHGDMREPIRVSASLENGKQVIEIRNRLLSAQTVSFSRLVDPFKSGSLANPNNKGGMGLGLYIANAILKGHGALLDASFSNGEACVRITIAPANE